MNKQQRHAFQARSCSLGGLRLWEICFIVSLAIPGLALAGVLAPAETPEPIVLQARAPAEVARVADVDRYLPAPTQPSRTLRCWQEGFLIVERAVSEAAAEPIRAVELSSPEQLPMQLHDLRNALCLIE